MKCPSKMDLSAYFDDELTSVKYRQIAQHVQGCPRCSGQLKELSKLVGSLKQLSSLSPEVPFGNSGLFCNRLLQVSRGNGTGWKPAVALTLLLVAAGIGIYWHQVSLPRDFARQLDYFVAEHEIAEHLHTVSYKMFGN